MKVAMWDSLRIGEAVRIFRGHNVPMKTGLVADKVHEQPGIYTVLVKVGRNGNKPLLVYVDIENIRRTS